jgi:hypothetical protein
MPYAAKATISHKFTIDQLDIRIEFSLPMKICSDPLNNPTAFDVKPPAAKWSVKLNGLEAEITSSDWLDQYTLHLLIENVAANPERLEVSFLGPDAKLITTWLKQWEPWADILSQSYSFLSGEKVYYVSDTLNGNASRKLTFIDGILSSET